MTTEAQAPGPNHDLFVRVLAQIEKHPETWDQTSWCGTACCFAGHAVSLSGLNRTVDPWCSCDAAGILGVHGVIDCSCATVNLPDLFDATNTLPDLYRISAEILSIDETVLRDKVAAEVGL